MNDHAPAAYWRAFHAAIGTRGQIV